MSTKKVKKPVVTTPEEKHAQDALDKFTKAHEGKTLTDPQKKERTELRAALGRHKFVRIANKRVPAVRRAIKSIGNLGGSAYTKSAAQVKVICDALENDVKELRGKLGGAKAGGDFVLPGFDQTEDEPKK